MHPTCRVAVAANIYSTLSEECESLRSKRHHIRSTATKPRRIVFWRVEEVNIPIFRLVWIVQSIDLLLQVSEGVGTEPEAAKQEISGCMLVHSKLFKYLDLPRSKVRCLHDQCQLLNRYGELLGWEIYSKNLPA